jgi:hypothetical protein
MSFQELFKLFYQQIIGDRALAHMALVRYIGEHLSSQIFQPQKFIAPAWFRLPA